MSDTRGEGGMMFAFLAGAIIGAGIGLLLAPKSGAETRRQIADLANKAKEKAGDLKSRLSSRVEEAAEGLRERKGA